MKRSSLASAWLTSVVPSIVLTLAMALTLQTQAATMPPPPSDLSGTIEQGRYLALAADCMACHTAPAGKPYAGGYALASPLGTIYASNITPSKTFGIGEYSEAQFARALRQGMRADGAHLYPAMPYTSYTLLSDNDVHALYAYFMEAVAPVEEAAPQTQLPFPFNLRWSMLGWNSIFLNDRRFIPDHGRSQQINRGAYLTNALAHCSACHTPRNALMEEQTDLALAGAPLGSWHAPNITSDPVSGVGGWSDAELVQYLKTGQAAGKAQAAGGMAEAVQNSLQYLHDDDITAIVAYLRTVPPVRASQPAGPSYAYGRAVSDEAALRGRNGPNEYSSLTSGAVLYSGYCASCHQPGGTGSTGMGGIGNKAELQAYPALLHNTATGAANPANLVSVILNGVERKIGENEVLMPRFDAYSYVNPLTDAQIASIANYVLKQYGNPDIEVSADYVAQARRGGPQPLLAMLQPYIAPAMVLIVLLVLLLIMRIRNRHRQQRTNQPADTSTSL
jgi:mono/diheme cytochrome c family protein